MANYTVRLVFEITDSYGPIMVGDTNYKANVTLSVASGTELICLAIMGSVYLNGVVVASGSTQQYNHTINSDITATYKTDQSWYIVEESGSGGSESSSGAHNALINGTSYAVVGGKVMVGGTAYEITNGKTLVGGTAYAIAFGGGEQVTVDIVGTGVSSWCYVEIDGVVHGEGKTIEIPAGTSITARVKYQESTIFYNGKLVAGTGSSSDWAEYTFIPSTSYVKILMSSFGPNGYNSITITDK